MPVAKKGTRAGKNNWEVIHKRVIGDIIPELLYGSLFDVSRNGTYAIPRNCRRDNIKLLLSENKMLQKIS